jgi:hypothetical protein
MRWRLRIWLLPLLLMLTASNARAANAGAPSGSRLFIEASLDNDKPWVGQEVTLTYTLFFSDIAPQIEDKSKSEHPGIWARELPPGNYIDSAPVSKNGVLFRKAVIKLLRLVPMQSGKLAVTNYRLRCLVPQNGQASLDSRNDVESIVTAPTAIVQARALPKPVPKEFSGAVGDFTLAVSPEKSTIHAGEPLPLAITISGKGNLDTPPPLTVTLPDSLQREASATPPVTPSEKGATSSVKTQIILIAAKEGSFRFVPVSLTVFDPATERYKTIRSNEVSINVIAGQAAVQPQSAVVAPVPTPRDDQTGEPTLLIRSIIALMAAATLLFIFGMHIRYMKLNSRKNMSPQNLPGAAKSAKPPAPKASSGKKSPESIRSELYEAIKKTGVKRPAGMTARELGKMLKEKQVKAQTIEAVTKLLSVIDHALYAPGEASPEKLESMSREAVRIITELSKL